MLNKKLVLGGLAGATLLVGAAIMVPTSADAAMSGVCSTCHTMHDSQGGADQGAAGQFAQLLLWDGCIGCHYGADNGADGRSATLPFAPQVGGATGANDLAGGYFEDTDALDAQQHNPSDLTTLNATADPLGNTPPGNGATALTVGLSCKGCHGDAEGGHHTYGAADVEKTGAAGSSYRMLNPDNTAGDGSAPAGIFVASDSAAGSDSPDWGATNATIYSGAGADLNAFCSACHPDFHGLVAGNQGTEATTWTRHPTDINMTPSATMTNVTVPTGADLLVTPVGTVDGAGGAQVIVMCISCHRPHGSAQADLLRFSYDAANNAAGDGTASVGCETCHGSK